MVHALCLPSSLYSIIAGMKERAMYRVHGWRTGHKKYNNAIHHPKPINDIKGDSSFISNYSLKKKETGDSFFISNYSPTNIK
jgi:hypothetical protein